MHEAVESGRGTGISFEDAWSTAEAGLGYVPWLAREFLHSGVAREDLESEARIGLFDAALRYDPTRGIQFITYASFWARRRMQSFVARHARIVRRPERRATRPAHESGEVSLDDPIGRGAPLCWRDILADPAARPPVQSLLLDEDAAVVNHAIAELPAIWRGVVMLRYGLNGLAPMTLQAIGDRLGLSRERVRQIEVKALRQLRSNVAESWGRPV